VTDRQIIVTGGLVGTLAGMAVGYLFFTPAGRQFRFRAERNLATFIDEAERLLSAADQVRKSVAEIRSGQSSGWPRSA
jgi:hypothetical protein